MASFNNVSSYLSTFSFKKITPTEVFDGIKQVCASVSSAELDGIEYR